ncbi:MAG: hypothetical protein WDW36_001220 [Sanguina aurantia]
MGKLDPTSYDRWWRSRISKEDAAYGSGGPGPHPPGECKGVPHHLVHPPPATAAAAGKTHGLGQNPPAQRITAHAHALEANHTNALSLQHTAVSSLSASPRLSAANTDRSSTAVTSTRPATAAANAAAAGVVTPCAVDTNLRPGQTSVPDAQRYPGPAVRCAPGAREPPVLVLNTLGNSSVLRVAPPPLPAEIPAPALQQPRQSGLGLRRQRQAAGPVGKPTSSESVSLARHVGLTGQGFRPEGPSRLLSQLPSSVGPGRPAWPGSAAQLDDVCSMASGRYSSRSSVSYPRTPQFSSTGSVMDTEILLRLARLERDLDEEKHLRAAAEKEMHALMSQGGDTCRQDYQTLRPLIDLERFS